MLWNDTITEIVPSIWQKMQWMLIGGPMQSGMQKCNMAETESKVTQRNNAV